MVHVSRLEPKQLRRLLDEAIRELPEAGDRPDVKARMAEGLLKTAASGVICEQTLRGIAIEEGRAELTAA
jgi:hypothetical protein